MITQNPLIGEATKSLGNATASKSFKKNVFRSKPSGQRKNSSPSQLTANGLFKSAQLFVSQFLPILKIGYNKKVLQMPLASWLIGYFMKTAHNNDTPPTAILPALLKLSEGPAEILSGIYIIDNDPEKAFRIGWDPLPLPGPGYVGKLLHLAWCKTDLSYFHVKINIPVSNLISFYDPARTTEKSGDVIRVWYFITEIESGLASECFTDLHEIQIPEEE